MLLTCRGARGKLAAKINQKPGGFTVEPVKNDNHSAPEANSSPQSEIAEQTYNSPKILEVGHVEELTRGSREQTADDGSGYQGG